MKKILDKQFQQKKVQYLVKWDEYFDSENTWKLTEQLKAAQQLDAYKAVNSATKKHLRQWNLDKWMRRR